MAASQNVKIIFDVTAIDQEKVEEELQAVLEVFGFGLVLSSGGSIVERDMLFERYLCEPNAETLKAIEEYESGNLKTISLEELEKELDL